MAGLDWPKLDTLSRGRCLLVLFLTWFPRPPHMVGRSHRQTDSPYTQPYIGSMCARFQIRNPGSYIFITSLQAIGPLAFPFPHQDQLHICMVKLASELPDSPSTAAKLLLGMLTGAKSCAKQTSGITGFSQQPREAGSIKIPVLHMRRQAQRS